MAVFVQDYVGLYSYIRDIYIYIWIMGNGNYQLLFRV